MYIGNYGPSFPSTKKSRKNYYVRVVLMATYIILVQSDFLWQLYGMMEWSYVKYSFNQDSYRVVSANVFDNESYYIEFRPDPATYHGLRTFSANVLFICYEIEGETYNTWTKLYPDHKLGDTIQIAVEKDDFQKIQRTIPYSIMNIPLIVWVIISLFWLLYFLGVFRVIRMFKKEDEGSSEYDKTKPTYIEQQKMSEDFVRKEQEKCIKHYVVEKGFNRQELYINILKNNFLLNSATEWYINEGASVGDIILLKDENGESLCIKETEYLRENSLPEEYYVIAIKDTYWLCCHAEEECIYAFSKALGLTHTKYQSLYDYIIDTCNIPFDIEKDS